MSDTDLPDREAMEFDVVIVGAGPAGLAAAIRLKQLNPELSVVVVEKGSEVGAHILSGAVIDPIGLDRLLPDWRSEDTPIKTPVTDDRFYWLGPAGGLRLPNFLMPPLMSNHGNFHRLARQCLPLARHQGGGARRRDLSGLRRRRSALWRRTARSSASPPATWASAKNGEHKDPLHARHGAARQIHAVRRRRARLALQAADRPVRARQGPRAAEIRHRAQGAVAGRAGKAQARAGAALVRLAARQLAPAAARSSIISTTTWWRSASSCT